MGEGNRFWPGLWANNDLEQGAMQIFLFVSRHDLQDFCVHGIACIEHKAHQSPVTKEKKST